MRWPYMECASVKSSVNFYIIEKIRSCAASLCVVVQWYPLWIQEV